MAGGVPGDWRASVPARHTVLNIVSKWQDRISAPGCSLMSTYVLWQAWAVIHTGTDTYIPPRAHKFKRSQKKVKIIGQWLAPSPVINHRICKQNKHPVYEAREMAQDILRTSIIRDSCKKRWEQTPLLKVTFWPPYVCRGTCNPAPQHTQYK